MAILVVGSVAYDTVETPYGRAERVLGGSASFFAVAASFFSPVNLVGVVGRDFGAEQLAAFRGRPIDLERLKPYTGTHNAGYTECQEFFGAITLDSEEPLGEQIVTMLDVALRGIGDRWNDVIIPGLDYIVVEDTLGKFGRTVEDFNRQIPRNAQPMVGNARDPPLGPR